MIGTLVNTGAVIAGSVAGLLIHKRFPERITKIAFQGIGLFTLFIGVKMAMESRNLMILVFSILIGAILGEALRLQERTERMGEWLKSRIRSDNEKFTDGLVTAFLLFCMGSMTVLGAIEEGLGGKPDLLLAKSVLDGFSSVALAASLGVGVLFSAIPLLLYQGGLTLIAGSLSDVLSQAIIHEVTGVGGLMLLGLGISILEIRRIQVMNMLPGLVVAALLAWFLGVN